MNRTAHLRLPFFDAKHRAFAEELDQWAQQATAEIEGGKGRPPRRRRAVQALGARSRRRRLAPHCVPAGFGGAYDPLQSLYLVIARETLARHCGLGGFRLHHAGPRRGPITLAGSDALKQRYLPRVGDGSAIAAFALTEPEAGSDVAAMALSARRAGDHYVLDGEKTFISNGGIADFYMVFARTGEAPGARGISAFLVEAGTPGFEIAERIEVVAPHPLARLRFNPGAAFRLSHLIGAPGEGFKIAMRTLDIFRAGVAAAALGFARRALDEALARVQARKMFGQTLGDFQLTQAALADMATEIDAAALLDLSGGVAARRRGRADDAGSGDGEDGGDRRRAARHRPGGADFRRARRRRRLGGRASLPGNPAAAHLRGRDRSAEIDHRPRFAEGEELTAFSFVIARSDSDEAIQTASPLGLLRSGSQ